MDKDTFQRLLQKQIEGKLSRDEEALLKQAYDQLFSEEIAAGANDPTLGPDDERGKIIRQKIYGRIDKPSKYPFNFTSFLKVAAAVIVVGLSSLAVYNFRFDILDSIAPVTEYSLAAGNDAVKMLTLEDGSVIWLNKNSRITYPERFRGKQRTIKLEGEAYFQVAHNKEKPFIVKSGALDVQVLGTTFVVSDALKSKDKAVTVLTGKVSVAAQQQQIAVLLPNQQVSYDTNSRKSRQQQVNGIDAIAFTKQDIDFRDTPISQIFSAMETRFGVHVNFSKDGLKGLNFSGIIKKEDRLEDVLDILSSTLNFHYKISNDSTITITAL